MAELPAMRLRLARMLADTMQIALNVQEIALLKRNTTTTADAYDEYLKGRFMLRHADLYPIASAVDAFERSLRLDDGFPDALAGQAWALALAYEAAVEMDNVLLAKASASVQRAMALGLTTPETFRILGMVEQFQGEYDRALEHLENAVRIGPSDAESQRRLSVAYVIKGRGDDALKAAQHAMASDPRNVSSYDILGLIQQYRGDYKAALQSYELGSRLASDRSEYRSGQYADVLVFTQQADLAGEILRDRAAQLRNSYVEHYRLGRILQSQGVPIQQWQDAFRQSEELIVARLKENPSDGVALSYDALVHTRVGRFKEAATAIDGALQLDSTNLDILYNASRMYALQRNKEKALEYLAKAIKRRYRLESILDLDFFNLRSDQGYLRTIVR
jgi:tetratricopeptide (TPR) repeat protein